MNTRTNLTAGSKFLTRWLAAGVSVALLGGSGGGHATTSDPPRRAGDCGWVALRTLATAIQPNAVIPALSGPIPSGGYSLAELADLGRVVGLPLIAVRVEATVSLPVPAILHWRAGHYSAVVGRRGGEVLIEDPGLGGRTWWPEVALRQQLSGYLLTLPTGSSPVLRSVSSSEAATICGGNPWYWYWNQCSPPAFNDDDDEPCGTDEDPEEMPRDDSSPALAETESCPPVEDCEPGQGEEDCSGGMPTWRVSEPFVNLWVTDTPLSYPMANGQVLPFTLRYRQRGSPAPNDVFGVGPSWEFSWRTYVRTNPANQSLLLRSAGGATREFKPRQRQSTNVFEPPVRYGGILQPLGAQVAMAPRFIHVFPRGSTLTYTNQFQPAGEPVPYHFLTEKQDRAGRTIRFYYQIVPADGTNVLRLTRVVDFDGRTNVLAYEHPTFKQLITSVTDPYGRSAQMSYDAGGRLQSITDVQGITSSFTYDDYGRLTSLVTPYGPTTFTYQETPGSNPQQILSRAIMVTLPNGAREVYAYRAVLDASEYAAAVPPSYPEEEVPDPGVLPDGTAVDNQELNRRNTYHWNSRAMEGFNGTWDDPPANHYPRARLRHWRFGPAGTIGRGLSFERLPTPDDVTSGHKNWYAYEYFDEGTFTSAFPCLRAERLPDTTTRYTQWERNDWARPLSITSTYDAGGLVGTRTQTFTYDSTGQNLVAAFGPERDPGNNLLRIRGYGYTINNQVSTFTNALGEVATYLYHTNRNPTNIALPSGLNIGLDPLAGFGLPTRLIHRSGATPLTTNAFTWEDGRIKTHTNPRNLTVTFYRDALGRLAGTAYPDGTSTSNRYERLGSVQYPGSNGGLQLLDLTAHKDRLDRWTTNTYNSLRQLTSVSWLKSQGGQTSLCAQQYDWCSCGVLNSVTDPEGRTVTYAHDFQGRLTALLHSPTQVIQVLWDATGRPTNVSDNVGSLDLHFNHQGLFTAASNRFGLWQSTSYDILDRPVHVQLASGARYTNTYDALGRLLTRQELNTGGLERFGYTPNLPGLTAYTNQLGTNVVRLGYDALGRLQHQLLGYASGGSFALLTSNRFTYTPAGDLETLTDGKNQVTRWSFDAYGRPLRKELPLGTAVWTNAYNANGWLTRHWTPQKGLTEYTHDEVGNPLTVNYPTSPDLTLRYDRSSRLTNLVDAIGTHAFTWSLQGTLASEDGPWPEDTLTFALNDARSRQSLTLAQPNASPWTQTYAYDASWRLTNVTSAAGAFAYYPRGASQLIQGLVLPGSQRVTNTFDALGRLQSTGLKSAAGATLNSHAYLYNPAHQLTRQTLPDGNYWDYDFDPLGQLTSAKGKESGGTARLSEQLSWSYDPAGNLAARTNHALIQTFTPATGDKNQLGSATRSGTFTVAGFVEGTPTSVTVKDNANAAQATTLYADRTFARAGVTLLAGTNTFTAVAADSYGRGDTNIVTAWLPASTSFTHDLNGNLTSDGRRTFEYDDADQLTAVQVAGAWRSEFRYDGFGRRRVRIEKTWTGSAWATASETRYVYDGLLVLQERDANNLPQVTYTRGLDLSGSLAGAGGIGGLLARTSNSSLLTSTSSDAHAYYHADAGGNVTALVGGTGSVLARYRYDPYGNLLGLAGPLAEANPYRFSSKEIHAASGLYYYGFRFYDPSLQRWLNRDPIGEAGGFNLYGFVGNDPLNSVDPHGLVLDTLWDLGNVLWDAGKAAYGYFTDDDCLVREGLGDLALDSAALAVPFVPAGTTKLVRVAKGVGRYVDDALSVADDAVGLVAKNADQVCDAAKTGTQVGYHATRAEFADSIMANGFRESQAGRLGGGGVYVNNSTEGAIAEYFSHNPGGPAPTVLRVEYTPSLNYRITPPPGGYTTGPLPLAADTLTTESVRLPGTFNTLIRNGTATPLRP